MSVPAEQMQAAQAKKFYKPPDEDQTLTEFRLRLRHSSDHAREWREEARDLFECEAGRQWDVNDEARLKEQNRPMVVFNLMSKFLDAVVGLQINNRQEIRCYPRQLGTAGLNELATGAIAWCRDQCDAEYEDTDAGHDCLLTGMGWTEDFLDDRADAEGSISTERRDPMEMFWDPRARKKNLSDARYLIRLKSMSGQDYEETFGKQPTGSIDAGMNLSDESLGVHIVDHPQDYQNAPLGSSQSYGSVVVADYQFFCVHGYWRVTAQFPGGGGTQMFSDEEWAAIESQLKDAKIPYQVDRMRERKFYRCWITADGIFEGIKTLPWQEGFTFHAITGKRDRNKNLWFGLGRNLKDPQRWVNAFFSSIIWQLMVNPKGGLLAEEGAFEDIAAAENSWADPSKITTVVDGALSAGKVQPKPAGNYPQGMDRLMTFSMEALPGVSGINAELLGMTGHDQPGVVEAQRKQGALAIVAWYFDALRLHYKRTGRCTLSMIRDFIADGRLIRIVGQEGAQYIPLLRDPLEQKFDIIVDEAPTSVNMRERVWAVLQQVIPMALQAGITIPKEVLDYAPLPDDLAQKWKQQLQPTPDQIQQKQLGMQLAQKAAIAKVMKDEASAAQGQAGAQLNTVKAQEISANAPSDIALKQVETVRKASEAGALQAGGG